MSHVTRHTSHVTLLPALVYRQEEGTTGQHAALESNWRTAVHQSSRRKGGGDHSFFYILSQGASRSRNTSAGHVHTSYQCW